ncbi:MAG: ribonucleotide-diphosphate reductase subunit beta [Opitutales bacterium]|nr:ribonucleotide-diphosphate reductase subunit beta [Opitutales bacterium]
MWLIGESTQYIGVAEILSPNSLRAQKSTQSTTNERPGSAGNSINISTPMEKKITIGNKTFVLDQTKAEAAFNAKKVINGRETMTFNLLPLKYQWAYELYRNMKANHWEPEDIPMGKDIEQWRDPKVLSEVERWIVMMGIGYFSAAEGIVGDNIIHVVRELVTAPELKLVLGRHAHEENIHADSLLYMISSLGINPHECEAMFEDVETIRRKNEFVTETSHALRRDLDMTQTENKKLLAKNIFVFGQCMEGTQFYGLFGMILSLYRQNKFPGIGQMFRYTLRDESNHIELFRNLFSDLVEENSDIWDDEFKEELRGLMRRAVELEKEFIRDCLPMNSVGLSLEDFLIYIDYIADRRLQGVGLDPLSTKAAHNPLPWLAEMMDIKKEQNFFEGRVTEYQKASSLDAVDDDDL